MQTSNNKALVEVDNKALIVVKNLEIKLQRKLILKSLNFELYPNRIVGFIGPNGAGKTTTIKTIIGAFKYKSGSISIKGFIPGTKEANSLIGYIPEASKFPGYLSVEAYLKTMAQLSGIKKSKAQELVIEILKKLKMSSFAKSNPNNLSSGQKKKIMLAQALINDPELLILDEPAANLDPIARRDFFTTLLKLKTQNKTIFLSSHILAELESIIDDVVFIYNGQILYSGSVASLRKTNFTSFIKTTDNKTILKILAKEKISGTINYSDEIEIENVNLKTWNKILHLISGSEIQIINVSTTDLTTIYKEILESHIEQGDS